MVLLPSVWVKAGATALMQMSMRTELYGKSAGEPYHGTLARNVMNKTMRAGKEHFGGHVDDLALTLGFHVWEHGLEHRQMPFTLTAISLSHYPRSPRKNSFSEAAVEGGIVDQDIYSPNLSFANFAIFSVCSLEVTSIGAGAAF